MLKEGLVRFYKSFNLTDKIVSLLGVATIILLVTLNPGLQGQNDLMNYHAYNGWEALAGFGVNNFHPAYTHTYFSNYIDILHWLILDNFTALNASIVVGLLQLLIIYPIYLVNTQLFKTYSMGRNFSIAILAVTPAGFFHILGTYTGDILAAIPVVFSFYWALKYISESKLTHLLLSAATIAMSLSLKLTNAGYLPIFLGLIVYVLVKKRWLHVILFTSVGALTFLTTMIPYFIKTLNASNGVNPFFPNYNNIFKSENFPEISFTFDILKTEFNQLGNLIIQQFVNGYKYDIHFVILCIAISFVMILSLTSIVNNNLKPSYKELRVDFIVIALFIISYLFYYNFFGLFRYHVALTVLMIPMMFICYRIISNALFDNNGKESLYKIFTIMLSVIVLLVTNPISYQPHKLDNSQEMFEAKNIVELNKYDAVIVTGPVFSSWLAVVNREYSEKHNQSWLSSAFNRVDAELADELLKNKKSVGYVAQAGKEDYAKQNLATLGYTTSSKCKPLSFDNYYGPLYETLIACDAVYTGIYKYDLDIEKKTILIDEAEPITPTEMMPFFGTFR